MTTSIGSRLSADRDEFRIVIELPWDASACMGTGAYSETMVRALALAAPQSTLILVVPLGASRSIKLPNVRYASLPTTYGLAEGVRHIALPAFLREVNADCLYAPASLLPVVKVCPMVASVLDLAFETHGELYSPELRNHLSRWFPATLAGADRIVVISESVCRDLEIRKRVESERIVLIEPPVRETFQEPLADAEASAELRDLNVEKPFFFHVSNLAVHKNVLFAVRAFSKFLKTSAGSAHQFLFAGGGVAPSPPPDPMVAAAALGVGSRVRYVGKVSDRALKALYQRCDAFLFPSVVEGWGLPVAEARALGARVLASPHVPAARSNERFPLEEELWASELEKPPRENPVEAILGLRKAGESLLGVIREAISSFKLTHKDRSDLAPSCNTERRPQDPSPTVSIWGDWRSPSGFGQVARETFKALEVSGLSPFAVAAPKDAIQDRRLWPGPMCLGRRSSDLWIHLGPVEGIDTTHPGGHAAYLFWETDRLPKVPDGRGYCERLSSLDEIWAPSSFVQEIVERADVRVPVVKIFPPVDTDLFVPGPRRPPPIALPRGFDTTWTVILYVGTWDRRKRPDSLVRSFTRAFGEKDKAVLLIKTYVTGDAATDRSILERWIAPAMERRAHVVGIPEVFSTPQMVELFRSATAFATASCGEGFCLPAVQALSVGNPVIASGWSSFRDLPVIPLSYHLESVPADTGLAGFGSDQNWAAVDEDDLARKLRWVHEHRKEAKRLGEKGRQWVLANASIQVTGKLLRERVEALCSSRSSVAHEVAR
jgi:glycosyltransferase involved in cell wall biosynthesis